jgi:cytochrome c-type biogenesis protein CcmH/NrfG
MANEPTPQSSAASDWQAKQVYAMAAICLLVGLAVGYFFRGSQAPVAPSPTASDSQAGNAQTASSAGAMGGQMPSLDQMKKMADTKAAPLLDKLKTDPNNSDLLMQAGNIYKATHQFKEAADYYGRALQTVPKNVAIRTELASCLYYDGDVGGAIIQLQQALSYDPNDANSLFNLGMMKWQGKQDGKGALAAWQQLLKSNPQLSADRKAEVQKLMADVQKQGKS